MNPFYIDMMYDSYKKIDIVGGIVTRLTKKQINVVFGHETTRITNNNDILLTSRYVRMFIYFLKFFV